MSERINTFRELRVYVEACELDFEVFVVSKKFPKEELYSLTDQVRRSSRSIGANIAEAWLRPVGRRHHSALSLCFTSMQSAVAVMIGSMLGRQKISKPVWRPIILEESPLREVIARGFSSRAPLALPVARLGGLSGN